LYIVLYKNNIGISMDSTDMVFEEWRTYAQRKALRMRALDLAGRDSNSSLKVIGFTKAWSDNYKGF
jgi:hypothetical protein